MYKQKQNNSRNGGFKYRTGGNNNFQGTRKKGPNKSFDPRGVIGKTVQTPQTAFEITHRFSDFNLDTQLARNIALRNYPALTPIQDQAMPKIMEGADVVGIANTGTGKTAAFLIPLINKVSQNRNSRVLIIAPTRELAMQIEKELQIFSRGMSIYASICIGGVNINNQIKKLQQRPQFVIGTPGRLLDLEDRHKIDFYHFGSIVLDEVDRMLDMGFIHDVNKIIEKLPKERQSLFFSATLDAKTETIMQRFVKKPIMITVKTQDIQSNIEQGIVELRGREKTAVLRELLDKEDVTKALIFMRTKHGADRLHKYLTKDGFQATVLHGDKRQNQRIKSLEQFKKGFVNILIATDVASRGIDVNDISHVINHDLPETYDDYIHRIGRTGRADKKGIALTFI